MGSLINDNPVSLKTNVHVVNGHPLRIHTVVPLNEEKSELCIS